MDKELHPGEEVELAGSMGKLFCLRQLPEKRKSEKIPVAVLCHGLMGTCHSPLSDTLAEVCLSLGIGCIRFDFNGCGKSEGDFSQMTAHNEMDDLLTVLANVWRQEYAGKIILMGHSQGGLIAGMTAGRLGPTQVSALCMFSATTNIRDEILYGRLFGQTFDPWHAPEKVALPNGRLIGRNFIQTAMDLPIVETIKKYTGPTFLLHGMADQIVPYTYTLRLHEQMSNSCLELLPGEKHRYETILPRAVHLVGEWLKKQFHAS